MTPLALLPSAPVPTHGETRERVANAARDFEALLIEQMLRGAREGAPMSLDGESDAARDTALDMADQEVARLMARQGGLGLAAMIVKNVRVTANDEAATGANSPAPATTPAPAAVSLNVVRPGSVVAPANPPALTHPSTLTRPH